ncbi:MAG: hypothetical protein LLG00_14155 [Planctomycetaceae bacterium]|nr:hypothetical protein [Planctomycetaceae bacterium]
MARPSLRHCVGLLVIAALTLVPAVGCQSLMFTVAYLWKGMDVPPEYEGLKGKKVAVVCRPLPSLQFSNSRISSEVAEEVSKLLGERVKKIKMVDQRKVAKWADENRWEEYREVGKAVKAEVVVGIELERLNLYESQVLYRGRANANIEVYDCKTGKLLFEKAMPETIYPPNMPLAKSDMEEAVFRKKFVEVLADRIGRHFYEHDPHGDLALDSTVLDK